MVPYYDDHYPPKYNKDLMLLREDLIGELQAINQYEAHAAQAGDPQVRALFMEIADDEKHHVADLLKMINRLDPVQARLIRERVCGYYKYDAKDNG
ncbi:hypothetical protein H0A61_01387 [Koleobacter methoxysyntrophicus]|uniref:Rubrerythrin diiron-binding domain-containing protein n=1 Tax=Koleobacter methoxysyntrophicus TaxID=2751313 RepID=A0A8A0RN53_9FIRM|nr:demethoxyubiquinone hydroxylase family protein [Koleobacter methoxysyntrophicus]QSQ09030.1 hypothetical protein H0A61_01387 [Koleobacter methoxysyntrophicus]